MACTTALLVTSHPDLNKKGHGLEVGLGSSKLRAGTGNVLSRQDCQNLGGFQDKTVKFERVLRRTRFLGLGRNVVKSRN